MLSALLIAPLSGDRPLQQQLYQRLKQAILSGSLPPETRLTASRMLASELGISRNTVTAVYEHLQAEGLITCTRQGSKINPVGTHLTASGADNRTAPLLANRVAAIRSHHQPAAPEMALLPGVPALSHFPLAAWRRAMNLTLSQPDRNCLGYGEIQGEHQLRVAIAAHLAVARGVRCRAENIVVVEGAQQALTWWCGCWLILVISAGLRSQAIAVPKRPCAPGRCSWSLYRWMRKAARRRQNCGSSDHPG